MKVTLAVSGHPRGGVPMTSEDGVTYTASVSLKVGQVLAVVVNTDIVAHWQVRG